MVKRPILGRKQTINHTFPWSLVHFPHMVVIMPHCCQFQTALPSILQASGTRNQIFHLFIFGADTVPGAQSWTGNVCVVVISQEALMMMVLMVVVVKVMVIMLW